MFLIIFCFQVNFCPILSCRSVVFCSISIVDADVVILIVVINIVVASFLLFLSLLMLCCLRIINDVNVSNFHEIFSVSSRHIVLFPPSK